MRASGTRSWHALLAIITAGVLIPTELPAQPRPASCAARFVFCDNCATTISLVTRKDKPCMIRYWTLAWRDLRPTRDETRQRNLRDREPHDRRVSTEARLRWQGLLRSRSQLRTVRNEAEDHPEGQCDHHGLTMVSMQAIRNFVRAISPTR